VKNSICIVELNAVSGIKTPLLRQPFYGPLYFVWDYPGKPESER